LFYGPPGTGKTDLTEKLAELMGFQLLARGLSSSEFCKSLVGQMKDVVASYLNRANMSPWLQCSLAIDEIEPLIMDRSDK
jgi:AAA+ superfamily predicted ATPase